MDGWVGDGWRDRWMDGGGMDGTLDAGSDNIF